MSSHGPQMWRKGSGPNGEEVYCPGRDVVNIFPGMLRQLVVRYNQRYWPAVVTTTAQLMGVSEDAASEELCKANDVFFKFFEECCRDSREGYGAVLRRVGWEDVAQPARYSFYMMLGTIVAGQMFASMRDVSMNGDVPPPFFKPLVEFHLNEARRFESGISSVAEGVFEFRKVVNLCVSAGLSYDDLTKIVEDLKLGRVVA